eukprot:CAMPEP_0170187708 /NCGR_PEP_ID=MMETSP0040_2-20121228/42389_1 /TAXON_ID=641309 /ORGANISM="Lotharella oceanica, Strain CCMP622" /LENGTH=351 /DNA_ID=CAMNT_0010434809 /DNA_START=337 /DNA_END=1392 /DNA_ORIENTATION=-
MAIFASSVSLGLLSPHAHGWYAVLIACFGFFQSTIVVSGVKVVASWSSKLRRGTNFGVYGSATVAGQIIGLCIAAAINDVDGNAALMPILLVPSIVLASAGVAQYFFVTVNPAVHVGNEDVPSIELLRIYKVRASMLAFSGVRIVDVTLDLWIVVIIQQTVGIPQISAILLSILYMGGKSVGSIFSGWMSDYVQSRFAVLSTSLIVGYCILCGFAWSTSTALLAVCLFVLGIALGGPIMHLPTTLSADIAASLEKPVSGQVTGLIDGVGTLIAGLLQLGIEYGRDELGCGAIFVVFATPLLLSACVTLSMYLDEAGYGAGQKPGFDPHYEDTEQDVKVEMGGMTSGLRNQS